MKKIILLLSLGLMAFSTAHKYYVSVTTVNYSEKEEALQITMRIFTDDMEALLLKRYGIETKLNTEKENPLADQYIEKYLRTKFALRTNETERPYTFLGKRYDADMVVCYLELTQTPIAEIRTFEVENTVLTDLFEDQQNVIHCRFGDQRKSFLLTREKETGVLKF